MTIERSLRIVEVAPFVLMLRVDDGRPSFHTAWVKLGHWGCSREWSLGLRTPLKEKLVKIGAKVVSHGRYVAFQMAEVAVPRDLFQQILQRIGWQSS